MDWGAIKQIAYGPLNLDPESLGKLTHGEFLDLYEGFRWREKRQWEQMAQLTSWITAPHVKKPIDPKVLLQSEKDKKRTTQEETKAVIEDLEKLMGVN